MASATPVVTTVMNLRSQEVIQFLKVVRLANRGYLCVFATCPVGNCAIFWGALGEVVQVLEVVRLANRGYLRGPATGSVGNQVISQEAWWKVREQRSGGALLKVGASTLTTATNLKPREVILVLEVVSLPGQGNQCILVQLLHLASQVEGWWCSAAACPKRLTGTAKLAVSFISENNSMVVDGQGKKMAIVMILYHLVRYIHT